MGQDINGLQRLFSQSFLSGCLDLLHFVLEQDDRTGLFLEQAELVALTLKLAKTGSTINAVQISISMQATGLIVILKIVF